MKTPMHPAKLPPAPSQDLFRLLVEQVKDYAIFMLDPAGIVISWNSGAERIKGYRASEIIGHHFSRFYQEEAIRAGWPGRELDLAVQHGRFEDEGWRVRKDGTRFWANVVITALYDDTGELRGFAKVTRDLTDRMRAERLEADARQMSNFVAMLAHELRNPLAPINNAVQLARRQPQDIERMAWSLGVIERQAGHLSRLVDDLLDIGRITRNQIRLERRRLTITEALEPAIEAVRPRSEDKQQTLTVEASGAPVVRGDRVRLTQVLTNLLANAVKYTPDRGRIEVRVGLDRHSDEAVVSVTDTGIGIPPDLLPRVFDIFTQSDRALDRAEGGLGIGLAIARRLVEMHGGTIEARSAGPGCGSEFVIRLPLAEPGGGSDDEAAADPHALTVLVVDDNVDSAETLQALLECNGHRTLLAFDGQSALTQARQTRPDVVLLDIGLPKLDGYEVARAIRGDAQLDGIRLVAITGYGTDEDRRRAIEAGFDLHFAKPIDFYELQRQLPMLAPA